MSVLPQSCTVCVLGAGITGLSAAVLLSRRLGDKASIVVVEPSQRVGGWAHTTVKEGHLLEHGVRSVRNLPIKGWRTLDLACSVGLADKVIWPSGSGPASKRFVLRHGELRELPATIISLLRHKSLAKALLREVMVPPREYVGDRPVMLDGSDDETVYDFAVRRLGETVADEMIDPLCRGIYAGDPRHLSASACFPILGELERAHGSLVKGALRHSSANAEQLRMARQQFESEQTDALVTAMKKDGAGMFSFLGGMGSFTDALLDYLRKQSNVQVVLGQTCTGVRVDESGTTVHVSVEESNMTASANETRDDAGCTGVTQSIACSGVISAMSSHSLAPIVRASLNKRESVELARLLTTSRRATVAVVNAVYAGGCDAVLPVRAFGYLVPRVEQDTVLGTVFDSCAFPGQEAPSEESQQWTRLSVMIGGADQPSALADLSTAHIEEIATEALSRHLKITQRPSLLLTKVNRDAIEHYAPGHSARVERVRELVSRSLLGRMELAGAAYDGVSVNDCVASAHLAVQRILSV